MKHSFEFQTSYNQFYIEDALHKTEIDDDFWSESTFNSRLAHGNGILGVGTYGYGNIKGEIEVLHIPSFMIDFADYDHVVEGGIVLQSGELQILDCPFSNVELTLNVNPGKYRVRIYGSNFASVEEPDLWNDTDNDYYKIEIWPSNDMQIKVLKQWTG